MLTLLEKSFIEKVKNIVENNFTSVDFDLEKFSEEIGMSQSQLRRKMNSLFNKSPNEFIRYYRLHKAAQKIRVEGVSVSEAAYSVGFNSLPYFSKCFSDEFGHSPSSIIKTTDNN
jgi:AraC-like DNA-binding protein